MTIAPTKSKSDSTRTPALDLSALHTARDAARQQTTRPAGVLAQLDSILRSFASSGGFAQGDAARLVELCATLKIATSDLPEIISAYSSLKPVEGVEAKLDKARHQFDVLRREIAQTEDIAPRDLESVLNPRGFDADRKLVPITPPPEGTLQRERWDLDRRVSHQKKQSYYDNRIAQLRADLSIVAGEIESAISALASANKARARLSRFGLTL